MELADTYQTARVLSVIEREREIKGVATHNGKHGRAPRRLNCISCSIFDDGRIPSESYKSRFRGNKQPGGWINQQ